eukprot:GSChrysophyteH1.ASY1.ANO1.1446.1 assembled CDS
MIVISAVFFGLFAVAYGLLYSEKYQFRKTDPSYAAQLFQLFNRPIMVLTLWMSISYIDWSEGLSWFNLHPLFMSVAFILLSGFGTLIKKLGGYENTKMHGMLLSLSFVSSLIGLYVIYSNKEMRNKEHFQTAHGQLGLLVIISYFSLMMFGGIFLHPDFGLTAYKTNQTLRNFHKWFGKFVMACSWYTAYTGFHTMAKGSYLLEIPVVLALGFFSVFLIFDQ